jgi:hypothetical protein
MNPAIMQMISTEQGRQMREQAAAWRRARETRSAVRARLARIRFALIARNARSWPGSSGCTARQQPENV